MDITKLLKCYVLETCTFGSSQRSPMFLEVKQLRTEQRKLQDTTLRIEKMLKEIGNMEEQVSKKSSIPRDLSVCYLFNDQC